MAKYRVIQYYSTYVTVEVEADGKKDAIEVADEMISNQSNLDELFDNLYSTGEVDVIKLEE